ncbi:alpha/beta hydrolase [Shimia sp. R9_1]|uniref:alpha/beta fold hydrolase n=1 Tax=Shimia sp. R9_1 TaxID=2821111 RepID=UPI001AD9ECD6|nr:alpha/beta hydrolase [Shimia sp. R9_1]MBO9408801.1 alpha/beta hydrolase [Shimia sp. R9_1]
MLRWIVILCLITILVVTAATWWKVQSRLRAARENFPPEGAFVEVGGHPVHYVARGNPENPTVVLIHGASGNTHDFTFDFVERLTDRYHVLVFDRPGMGHTPPLARKGVTLIDQATLLSSATKMLGADNPIVVGQSFGGAVTMAWAVHHPDHIAAAVSIAGATYPWQGPLNPLYKRIANPWIGTTISRLIAAWASEEYVAKSIAEIFAPQAAPEGYAEAIAVPLILRPHSLIANAQQRTDLREELRALAPQYQSLSLPVEIVHGDADTIVGLTVHSTRMVEDISGAHLVTLEGVGHMPHHTNPDEIVAAIDRAATRAGLH